MLIFSCLLFLVSKCFSGIVHNALPVEQSAAVTFTKKKSLGSIGFTGMLHTVII